MKKRIIWIAAYTKSGNTWARTILTSLFFTKNGKFNFEILKSISIFENVERFEFVKEINLEDYMIQTYILYLCYFVGLNN